MRNQLNGNGHTTEGLAALHDDSSLCRGNFDKRARVFEEVWLALVSAVLVRHDIEVVVFIEADPVGNIESLYDILMNQFSMSVPDMCFPADLTSRIERGCVL